MDSEEKVPMKIGKEPTKKTVNGGYIDKTATSFKDVKVNEVITLQKEKDTLFDALKTYQSSSDIRGLVQDLRRVLNEPSKLDIYDYVRPLIRPQHQQNYDKMAPAAPGQRLRVIKLRRRVNESLGFAVRGGLEHGIGVFVSNVDPGSQAEHRGLRMGDQIVRVNGFTIAEAIHEEVLNLIKGRDEIELKVTNIGMVPIKQTPTDPVTWQYVDKKGGAKLQEDRNATEAGDQTELVKIFINLHGAPGLGCSILSGPKTFPGIFVESVRPGSLGEDYGLEVGDQIVEVNGKSFDNIKHKEAIVELKGSKELNMVIRKYAGLPMMKAIPKGNPAVARQPAPGPPIPVEVRYSEPITAQDSEILEEDRETVEELRRWEQEQTRLRKFKEEEAVKAEFRRREADRQVLEKRKREEELERQKEEERRRNEEEKQQRLEEEQRRINEEKARERESKLREEEDEKRKKQELIAKKQQTAVLAGRSGPKNSMKPTLLGAATPSQSSIGLPADQNVKDVLIKKEEDIPLDIELEGGTGSPLPGGKVVVADIYYNGAVDRKGGIKKGDQILKVNGHTMEGLTLTQAQEILWKVEQETKPGDMIKMTIAECEFKEDEITYF